MIVLIAEASHHQIEIPLIILNNLLPETISIKKIIKSHDEFYLLS